MNFAVGLLALVLLPAYVCRINVLQVQRDPPWETLGTYGAFVLAVMAGGAALRSEAMPMHLAMVVLSGLWLMATYHRRTALLEQRQ